MKATTGLIGRFVAATPAAIVEAIDAVMVVAERPRTMNCVSGPSVHSAFVVGGGGPTTDIFMWSGCEMHARCMPLVSWFLIVSRFQLFFQQSTRQNFLPWTCATLSPDVLTGLVRTHVVAVRAHDHSTMPVPPSSPVAHVPSPRATAFRGSLAGVQLEEREASAPTLSSRRRAMRLWRPTEPSHAATLRVSGASPIARWLRGLPRRSLGGGAAPADRAGRAVCPLRPCRLPTTLRPARRELSARRARRQASADQSASDRF